MSDALSLEKYMGSVGRRVEGANRVVRDHAFWAAGVGLLPLPFIDFATITVLQTKMVGALTAYYRDAHAHDGSSAWSNEPVWPRERTRAVVTSLVGSAVPVAAGSGLGSMLKAVPVLGTVLGTITTPALAWASTIALGRVFIEHFESGGTLLDFKPEKVRRYYYEQVRATTEGDSYDPARRREDGAAAG